MPQLIQSYLEELTSASSADEEIAEIRRLSMKGKGRSRGWKFDRDQLHERP